MTFNEEFGKKWFEGYLKVPNTLTTPKTLNDVADDEFCNLYAAFFMSVKGILLGRIIGYLVPKELIPECYSNAIYAAVAKAEQAI